MAKILFTNEELKSATVTGKVSNRKIAKSEEKTCPQFDPRRVKAIRGTKKYFNTLFYEKF